MSRVWKFKPCEEALVERLFQCLENVPKPLAALLVQRGCTTAEDAYDFMNPALSTLRDPFELPDMTPAVERVRRALADGEKITVFGDYDADGVCSTALMVRVLRGLGGNVSAYIPGRLENGYGLSPDALQTCVELHGPSLIVTVDCGTGAVAAVEAARERGVDIVVTDHHEPGEKIASAVAVVNPKRVENHPASILAGVGVAFKVCHALIKAGRDDTCAASTLFDLKSVLDFVAVATVTDMVPLLGENRALVRAGFQTLENSAWPGWGALKRVSGLRGPLETWHAGFTFGPRINAAGRVGRADAALDLFLTDLPEKADELAALLDESNRERQAIERDIVKEAVDEIDSWFDETRHFGLVVAREGWHAGVIGIVASRLIQRYGRPVAVIGIDGDRGRGSCRSIEAFSVLDGLHACADLLVRHGGHEMAAGLEVKTENLDAFRKCFNDYAYKRLKDVDLSPVLEIDRMVDLSEIDSLLMSGLRRTGPFGQDNPEPIWAVMNVNVADSRILKEKHLKLTFTDGRNRVDAIGFNMAEKLPDGPVDIAFSLHENTWNGRTSLQLNLKDIRPTQAQA
ncbi:single-stranded-DNA-specific exonuclease RecJ [Tichowtungia aerotolerans]|uniref:Single-stranded-DNA-specific exonuclease RecJ n=1 Tax=Tichowtungia aerotolerans TaxID=2697043 RepID=A0A6P1M746_9BACT|nr:single-stranded-DNA-specific exonuclease RecJ [Tichowtungia aerotolerans]QHI69677.1 single-stranded-DNA-specific exonuclease RecJ [Tichowtungia aerotolerans]